MEKRSHISAYTHYCTCSNHLLLMPGCECDLCMGVVADHDAGLEIMAPQDRYDQAYFEALERMYSNFEFAA